MIASSRSVKGIAKEVESTESAIVAVTKEN